MTAPEFIAGPQIYNLDNDSGSTAGGQPVQISGVSLESVAYVHFGDAVVQPKKVAETTVYCDTPPHSMGTVYVWVSTSSGVPSNKLTYTYVISDE